MPLAAGSSALTALLSMSSFFWDSTIAFGIEGVRFIESANCCASRLRSLTAGLSLSVSPAAAFCARASCCRNSSMSSATVTVVGLASRSAALTKFVARAISAAALATSEGLASFVLGTDSIPQLAFFVGFVRSFPAAVRYPAPAFKRSASRWPGAAPVITSCCCSYAR